MPTSIRLVTADSAPSAAQGDGRVAVGHHVVLGDEHAVEACLLDHLSGFQDLLPPLDEMF